VSPKQAEIDQGGQATTNCIEGPVVEIYDGALINVRDEDYDNRTLWV
jgi:hypothetical protein